MRDVAVYIGWLIGYAGASCVVALLLARWLRPPRPERVPWVVCPHCGRGMLDKPGTSRVLGGTYYSLSGPPRQMAAIRCGGCGEASEWWFIKPDRWERRCRR